MFVPTKYLNQLGQGLRVTVKACTLQASTIVSRIPVVIECEGHRQGQATCVLYRRSRLRRTFDGGLEALLAMQTLDTSCARLALEQLAISPDPNSRLLAARDMRSPEWVLSDLKDDWWWEVRAGLAVRMVCPLSLQRSLLDDGNPWVRRALAENPEIAPESIDALAHDADFGVRDAAAEHPKCSAATQVFLANDVRWEIRRSIAKRPDAPIEALTNLCHDPEPWVRFFVAANPTTPDWLRAKLERDTVAKVRSMARHADTQMAKITNSLAFGLIQNPPAGRDRQAST